MKSFKLLAVFIVFSLSLFSLTVSADRNSRVVVNPDRVEISVVDGEGYANFLHIKVDGRKLFILGNTQKYRPWNSASFYVLEKLQTIFNSKLLVAKEQGLKVKIDMLKWDQNSPGKIMEVTNEPISDTNTVIILKKDLLEKIEGLERRVGILERR